MSRSVVILIPAAGASSRMGGADKLLETIGAEPLIARSARIAAGTGCRVLVTLPPDRPARQRALGALPVRPVVVDDAASGMSASLRRGAALAATMPGAAGLMVLPADMPGFTEGALSRIISAFLAQPDRLWRGQSASRQEGHPAIFPRALWPELAALSGDHGGLKVIRAHPDLLQLLPLPGDMAVLDLDTPEDWRAYRAQRAGAGRKV